MQSRRTVLGVLTTLPAAISAAPLRAATAYEITMLSQDRDDPSLGMRFSPDFLKVPAGSTVTFTAGASGHNAQTTRGMIPEGADGWRFGIGRSGTVTLNVPGFYGYHCLPHRGLGMVGLIIVEGPGMMANYEAAKSVRQFGKAAERWNDLWARADALL